MSILQMSVSAGLLVIAVVIIRAIALNRLPKTMFLILWGVVLLRLLVPVSIPSQFSVYTAIGEVFNQVSPNVAAPIIETVLPIGNPATQAVGATGETEVTEVIEVKGKSEAAKTAEQFVPTEQRRVFNISPTMIIWLIGTLATFTFFVTVYFKNNRVLRFALCVRGNDFLKEWLTVHRLLRPIFILQSDRIMTPVAVGIVKPRIILPKAMNMDDIQLLRYVLTHEYYHIRRLDTLWKVLLALAICIHWFNPLIWVMFILVNRDLELTCDEMVIRHFGADAKTAYAYSLIGMAEQRSGFTPLYNSFSKNAAEERIRAIMKYKKSSVLTIALAVLLVAGTTTAFAFSSAISESPIINIPNIQNDIADVGGIVNNETAPLRINSSGVQYDDSAYRWPSNAISITNISDKEIAYLDAACLAYDKNGSPIELYWDALNVAANGEVGSVGFGDSVDYGFVTDIYPVSPKSNIHIYKITNLQWELSQEAELILQEWEQEKQAMQEESERQSISQEPKQEIQTALEEMEQELKLALQKTQGDISLYSFSNGKDTVLSYSLFDGWNQSTGEHNAEYIIACIKQATFGDGSVWVNPEYENWLANYQGKSVAINILEDYYKDTQKNENNKKVYKNGLGENSFMHDGDSLYNLQLDDKLSFELSNITTAVMKDDVMLKGSNLKLDIELIDSNGKTESQCTVSLDNPTALFTAKKNSQYQLVVRNVQNFSINFILTVEKN